MQSQIIPLAKRLGMSMTALAVAGGGALGAEMMAAGPAHAATPAHHSPAPAGSSAPLCATSQLEASPSGGNGAAGSVDYILNLTNTSSSTCTLTGYPGVSYVAGSSGTQVGSPAVRTPGDAQTVVLGPGHAAQAGLREVVAQNFPQSTCRLTTTRGLRVYPPNQKAALFVAQPGHTCANPADHTLFVGPVETGPAHGGTGPTPPARPSANFSDIAGRYVGSTGSSGTVFIRSDGASRYTNVDLTACPSCSTANAPQATIDFRLTTIAGGGTYRARGVITAESDPANARTFAGPVGATVGVAVSPPGDLRLSFLPGNDVLMKTTGQSAHGGTGHSTTPAGRHAATGQVTRVPVGAPQTGAGSTAGLQDTGLLAIGAGLVVGVGVMGGVGIMAARRRRAV